MLNQTLKTTYDRIGTIQSRMKARVKQIMGWRGDAPFYDRVNGRVKCTQAEQDAFIKAFNEMSFDLPAVLFPEAETAKVLPVE